MTDDTKQELLLLRSAFTGAINDAMVKHGKRAYNMTVQVYTQNQSVPVARNCFAFMFTNVGDTTATVEGMVVFPSATPLTALGDSRTIAAHEFDIYTGNITISLRGVVGPAPGVEIVQLYYV
jgi:hypothetical protein